MSGAIRTLLGMESSHRIVAMDDDIDETGSVYWRCRCGEDADGYSSLFEARYAAAEHQLPANVQREIEDLALIPDHIETWRAEVAAAADETAATDPAAWDWYLSIAKETV
jgi:hypothetical protein